MSLKTAPEQELRAKAPNQALQANDFGLSCLLLPAEPAAQDSRQPSAVAEFSVVGA